MFCRDCRYPLRDLPEGTCPECGCPFVPDDPKTFLAEPDMPESIEREAAMMCVLPMVLFVVAVIVMGAAVLFIIEFLLSP